MAALNDNYSENPGAVNKIQREIRQLKDMIQNLCSETDARIRGLARRNQSSRNEQPRERTCDGRMVCYTCGRTGHLHTSCPERRNSGPQSQPPQQQSYRPSYSPNSNYNQLRDNYRNYSQPNRRDQRLAVLAEGFSEDELVAQIQQNPVEPVLYCSDLERSFLQENIEQRENVKILSNDAVVFSKQMLQYAGNLFEKLTLAHAPLLLNRATFCAPFFA